jgi:GntR family transcriptional regulator of arabinose operon
MNIELKKDAVYRKLKEDIISGKLSAGTKLPKGTDLAKQLDVSHITLRSAMENLEEDGFIIKVHGKGTFVTDYDAVKKKKKVLVITSSNPEIDLPWHYIVPGVENAASEHGFETEACPLEYFRTLNKERVIEIIKENNITSAVLVAGNYEGNENELSTLRASNIPVVLPHASFRDSQTTGFAIIMSDTRRAWRDALEYLVSQGHKRIGFLMKKNTSLREYDNKEFVDLLKDVGIDAEPKLIAVVNNDEINDAVQQLTKSENRITAMMCYSDFYAFRACRMTKKLNLRIPEDIAVMGYCGYPGGVFLEPSLSTVDLGYNHIGHMAIKVLEQADKWFFSKEKTAPPVLISPHQLIERQSTKIRRSELAMVF